MTAKKRVMVWFVTLTSALFLLTINTAYGAEGLRITEINYNPEGTDANREWIELHNTSSSVINISEYRFHEGDSSDHPIREHDNGGFNIEPDELVIIAKNPETFLGEFNYKGKLFKASFSSLKNGQDESVQFVAILENRGGNSIAKVSYSSTDGGNGDGTTIHITNDGSLFGDTPNPGEEPGTAPTGSRINTQDDKNTKTTASKTSTSTNNSSSTRRITQEEVDSEKEIYINADDNNVLIAGTLVNFYLYRDNDRVSLSQSGTWNFGDGSAPRTFGRYVYDNAGEYIVTFFFNNSDVLLRRTVIVREPNIVATIDEDNKIVISNRSANVIDISNWTISVSDGKSLQFHENTFLSRNSSLILPLITARDKYIALVTPKKKIYIIYRPEVDTSEGEVNRYIQPLEEEEQKILEQIEEPKPQIDQVAIENLINEAITKAIGELDLVRRSDLTEEVQEEVKKPNTEVQKEINSFALESDENYLTRQIIIWIALLIGLFTTIISPLFLSKLTKKKKK